MLMLFVVGPVSELSCGEAGMEILEMRCKEWWGACGVFSYLGIVRHDD